jgi:hypothetical protein
MRNLIDVINEMLKVVPKKEEYIISCLKDIQDSQKYRAPEDMIGWHQVSELLQEFEYNGNTPMWKLEMCSIFSTRPLEEILNEVCQKKAHSRLSKICQWMRKYLFRWMLHSS